MSPSSPSSVPSPASVGTGRAPARTLLELLILLVELSALLRKLERLVLLLESSVLLLELLKRLLLL